MNSKFKLNLSVSFFFIIIILLINSKVLDSAVQSFCVMRRKHRGGFSMIGKDVIAIYFFNIWDSCLFSEISIGLKNIVKIVKSV